MLTPVGYKKRIIDDKISKLMNIYGAVCIEGPKWCGKTWTSKNHASSASYIGDPAGNFMNKQLAELDPSLILEGDKPRLIDEWQVVPNIWDAVRYKVDQSSRKGEYILTGSSTPHMKGKLHSGSGRIGKISMRTMSLMETGASSGVISIIDLFNSNFKPLPTGEISLDKLIDLVVRGGWPGLQELPLEDSLQIPRDYLQNIPYDMERIDGIKRDSRKVKSLLRALGRAESNMTSKKKLQNDIEEFSEDSVDYTSVSIDTISDFLDCFNRMFLLEDQPAFEKKLRSSIKALKTPKRHFVDPSLAVAAIDATPQMLKQDLNTFGYMFESLCIHDLRIYADYYDGKVYHYHDERGNEADAIIQLPDGRWGMFEVKVGFNQVEKAAKELLCLKAKFEAETNSSPEFLCIICGMTNMAFQRSDGVYVVPITSLGI